MPTKPRKKIRPEFHESASAKRKPVAKTKRPKLTPAKPRELRERGWMIAGFDTSMSSIAGAAVGYDRTLDKLVGPEFVIVRWTKEDDYFSRLKAAALSHDLVQELQTKLGLILNMDEIHIAQEEPWPLGMVRGGLSAYLKQQAEISGAFLGGLVRWGYQDVFQINSIKWRTMVADYLGITTHHSKWRSPELAAEFNCKPTDSGKFRSKEWALDQKMWGEIPEWPDIIESGKLGKIPRPENSKAKAVQPDDRYDALAVMWWLALDLAQAGVLKGAELDGE